MSFSTSIHSSVEKMETRYRGSSRVDSGSEFDLPSPSYNTRSRKRERNQPSSSPITLLLVASFVLAVFAYVRYIDFRVPKPLTTADISDNPHSFIEERARNDLITLSFGPRVAGSHANDVITVDALLRILKDIDRTKFAIHSLEYEIQKPTGSFYMLFQDGLTSSYANIPNVVVKLEPAGSKVNNSILVNCHFDSVPDSPGATDDMISCAVMLEALRVLTRKPESLKNAIVMLFNGAEENLLQGAHGFIKGKEEGSDQIGHRWSKNIKTFINLEGAGAGSREILFQTGPGNSWLLDSYRTVPYPWGSVVGEEIFQKGLIPSDTDFRIFRDYANIPGLDMAFVKNGFVYHTKFDCVEEISPGSIQHEGSNVLALLESLGNVDFSQIKFTDTKMVFFDVFGYFMIIYSEYSAIIINLIVAICVLAISWKEAEGKASTLLWFIASTLGAWVSGILTAVIVGLLLNFLSLYSPYHSYPTSVFLLYGIPCLVGQVLVYSYTLRGSEDYAWIAGKTTLAFILLFATFFTRIVFSVTFNIAFGVVGWYSARKFFQGYRSRLAFYLVVGEAFPMALSLYLVTGCVDTFVPIMGRAGSDANPNLFLAVLTSFTLSIPTFTGIVPILLFFKRAFLRGSAIFMLLVLAFIVLIIGRVPYQDKTPMRVHIIEVDRTYFDTDLTTVKKHDAGFWFFNVDSNIPEFYNEFEKTVPQLKNREVVDAYNCQDLYCGLPFVFPVKKLIRRSDWVPKENGLPTALTERVRMEVTQDSFITPSVRRISLSFVGPDHLTINFSPGKNYEIAKWTLTDKVPAPMSVLWNGRPTYFVYHARGIAFQRFNVTIDFRKKTQQDASSTDPLVDINYSCFYIHGEEMKSQDLKELIRRLPSWTYVLGFSGVSQVYSIPV